MPSSLEVTDQESAAVATKPRVTLDEITRSITGMYYVTGYDVASATHAGEPQNELRTLTICLLVMKNGFTVIGKAAPASPENFNVELGRKFAYEDAVRQLWPLMGFALREKLSHD